MELHPRGRRASLGRHNRFRLRPFLEELEGREVPAGASITGHVFSDANNNGIFDAGEKAIPGSLVELRNAQNEVLGSSVTSASGLYRFDSDATVSTAPATKIRTASVGPAAAGWVTTRAIEQLDPAIGQLTSVELVLDGALTSSLQLENHDEAAASLKGSTTGSITLRGPADALLKATGSVIQTIELAAYDGVTDFDGASGETISQEAKLSSAALKLTGADELAFFAGAGTVELSLSSQASSTATGGGSLATVIQTDAFALVYVIYHYIPNNNLRSGSYSIIQPASPQGYFDGKESRSGTLIEASFRTDTIAVQLVKEDLSNNDFGELAPSSLAGAVFIDANNNGILDPGEGGIDRAIVTLRGTTDVGQTSVTASTDRDGGYSFKDLRAGSYSLTLTPLTSFLDGKESPGSLGGASSSQLAVGDIPVGGGVTGSGYLFGQLAPSSISGSVFNDANRNSLRDPNEAAIPNVAVALTGTDDRGSSVSQTTVTDEAGAYAFTGLRPGKYVLAETQPSGYLSYRSIPGPLGGAALGDQITLASLGSGTNASGNNFAELVPSTLTGTVYLDRNNNGNQEFDEPGLAGITVTLLGLNDQGTTIQQSQRTNEKGRYAFEGLRPGAYTISQVQDRQYIDGQDRIGQAGGTLSNDRVSGINLISGVIAASYDFAERPAPHPFGLSLPDIGGAREASLPTLNDAAFGEKIPYLSTVVASLDSELLARAVFIEGLYRSLLGRDADLQGLAYWVQQYQAGLSRAQIVHGFWVSTEHRGVQVDALYKTFFRREADAGGRAAWVKALVAGANENNVALAFMSSPEYQARYKDNAAFVNALYADVLGRYAGGDEVAGWVAQLQKNSNRDAVIRGFVGSTESLQRVVDWSYRRFLLRAPDPSGLQAWVSQLQAGKQTAMGLGESFLASDEFFQRARAAIEG